MKIRGLEKNDSLRQSTVFLHIGAKKTGKTQGTLSAMSDMWSRQGKPTLILDINGQPEYNDLHTLDIEDIEDWASIWPAEKYPFFKCRTIEVDRFFALVHQHVVNSFVVFEDSTSYMCGNLSQDKKVLIFNSRNASNDYFFNLHSLGDPAPLLFKHSEFVILRRTLDDPKKLPTKILQKHLFQRMMAEIEHENATRYRDSKYKLAFRRFSLIE